MQGSSKLSVVVLMGGKTPEHEVSLISGAEVVKYLPSEKYQVLPMVISKNGLRWQLTDKTILLSSQQAKRDKSKQEIVTRNSRNLEMQELKHSANVVFIAMHGPFGEDGTVQGMLELVGIPYTGSGVLASAIGMNKIIFRKLMNSVGIPVPNFVELRRGENAAKIFQGLGKPPYFAKPHNQGSSIGVSIVKSKKELPKALEKAWQYSDIALVEEFLRGTEVTCALLGNENPQPLPVVEIIPGGEFFDYRSKYMDKNTREIAPARISKKLTKEVQGLAVKVHKTVGCRGFSRVDFILRNNKKPIVLEINTIPGLTPASLLPKAAKAAGISYPQLLDKIIQYSLE